MKSNIFTSILALYFLFTASIFCQTIGETGKFSVNPATPGFTLDKGDGERTVNLEIRFTKKFTSKPELIFSVSGVDASRDANLRYSVESTFVSNEGFLLKIKTWGDTKIFGITGSWIAITE
jgi:hypothetical protein